MYLMLNDMRKKSYASSHDIIWYDVMMSYGRQK